MKTVFLFPGQGAQYPGMGKDLWEKSASVKELFRLASGVTGCDMQKLLFEGSAEELKATDKTQGAITLANLSAAAFLREQGIVPNAAAGFSLGEYAALVTAGVIGAEAVFSLVKFRGEVMEKASRALDTPEGSPGMAAVMGLDLPDVRKALESAGITDVYAANYNSPVQTVVSGSPAALAAAETALKAAGARRCIRLAVSGPFHSPLLADARKAFEAELAKYSFADPAIPVFSNVTGKIIASGDEAKRLAGEQITTPVLWVDIEKNIQAGGYERILEVGPGTVLAGLWKALYADPVCRSAGTAEAIERAIYAGQG
ncbi:MAG: ACP S-malonyltransferase [Spirochaetales bacterium]|jgi:[acyl-carrier-protein] S-malonyltransferase|nr:ACP S-malonyltransferase [Spirochaetales bacterium]